MIGGSCAPVELIHALIDKGAKNLAVINNNAGNGRIVIGDDRCRPGEEDDLVVSAVGSPSTGAADE